MRLIYFILLFFFSSFGFSQPIIDSIVISNERICKNNPGIATVYVSPMGTYNYQWQTNGIINNPNSVSTNYSYSTDGNHYLVVTVDDGFGNFDKDSVLIQVHSFTSLNLSTSSLNVDCAQTIDLNATLNTSGSGVVVIGNTTGANSNSFYPAPFGNFYSNTKQQYLILASELINSGFTGGNIFGLNFFVSSVNGLVNYPDYTIKMGHTNLSTLISTFENVDPIFYYGPLSTSVQAGTNTFNFSTPFIWDGINNIIVEVCNSWVAPNTYTLNSISPWTTTLFNSSNIFISDNVSACTATSGNSLSNNRPIIDFIINQNPISLSDSLYYLWNNGNFLNDSLIQNPIANPLASSWFTVTVTDSICSISDSVFIHVDSSFSLSCYAGSNFNTCVNELTSFVANQSGQDSLNWYFTGANIDSSDIFNPSIYYDTIGDFPFVLTGYNQCGFSSTINQIMHVLDSNNIEFDILPFEDTICTIAYFNISLNSTPPLVTDLHWIFNLNGTIIHKYGTFFDYNTSQTGIAYLTLEGTRCGATRDTTIQFAVVNCLEIEEENYNWIEMNIVNDNLIFNSDKISINSIRLFSLSGQEIEMYLPKQYTYVINVSNLAAGIYLIEVDSDLGRKVFKIWK